MKVAPPIFNLSVMPARSCSLSWTRRGELTLRTLQKFLWSSRSYDGRIAHEVLRLQEQNRRTFLLQVVQPALAGLMDGSVSTLAPVFAAALATQSSRAAFLVGLASSVGAGISMGFAEVASDDGRLTGRGRPLLRGAICGLATVAGGIGHTLPYLLSSFRAATVIAIVAVALELLIISWIRKHYMDTPFVRAAIQVIVGGVLVFLVGVGIGSS